MTSRRNLLSSTLYLCTQGGTPDSFQVAGSFADGGGMRLGDLIDLADLQAMVEAHSKASGMPIGVIDAFDGSVLVGVGWQAICMEFHRKHPETLEKCLQSDASIKSHILDGKPFGYKCRNGLWDIGVPIMVQDVHVATLFLGQFFYDEEPRDTKYFEQQASQYGFDKKKYLGALEAVPSFSKEVVDNILLYNAAFAQFIGKLASGSLFQRVQLQSLTRYDEELSNRLQFINALLAAIPLPIFIKDTKGVYLGCNKAFVEFTGMSDEQMVGKSVFDLYPRELAEKYHEMDMQLFRSGGVQRYDFLMKHHSGEPRNVIFSKSLYYDRQGKAKGLIGVVTDITDRLHMQDMLVQAEKMRTVAGLAAGMAHEINNPLASILQSVQNALRRLQTEDMPANLKAAEKTGCDLKAMRAYLEQRDIYTFLESIKDAGERAAKIVTNMLEFSRTRESVKAPVNINELLDKAVNLSASDYDLKKKYDFRKVIIERDYAPDLPRTPCTVTQIEQVFMNALRNSAQAMAERPEGAPPPRILLRTRREGGMVRIEVEDNGPGMSEDVRRRVFDPFFTTKVPGEGTGLGLSVSYYIVVSNHNGVIRMDSWPGKGSRMTIELPVVDASAV